MSEPNTTGNWHTQTPGCGPSNTPPASDLGALDPEVWARLQRKLRTVGYVVIDHQDFRALLTAYDAQAARLAAGEQSFLVDERVQPEHDLESVLLEVKYALWTMQRRGQHARVMVTPAGDAGAGEARDGE